MFLNVIIAVYCKKVNPECTIGRKDSLVRFGAKLCMIEFPHANDCSDLYRSAIQVISDMVKFSP